MHLYPPSLCAVFFIDALHWHSGTQIHRSDCAHCRSSECSVSPIRFVMRCFYFFDVSVMMTDSLWRHHEWLFSHSRVRLIAANAQFSRLNLARFLYSIEMRIAGNLNRATILILPLHRRYDVPTVFSVVFPMMVISNNKYWSIFGGDLKREWIVFFEWLSLCALHFVWWWRWSASQMVIRRWTWR